MKDARVKARRRKIDHYNPKNDAAQRWPEWTIETSAIVGYEKVIYPDEKTILINEECDSDVMVAEAVAHLDLAHHEAEDGLLSDEQQAHARWIAEVRMDRERSRETADWGNDGTRPRSVDDRRNERPESP